MNKHVVMIDNEDSFTFNLIDYIERLGYRTTTVRNDFTPQEVEALQPNFLILSPGPSHPENAGYLVEYCKYFAGRIPVLGVCLGFQAMVIAFGGRLATLSEPVQGYASMFSHEGGPLFESLPQKFLVGRYHALYASKTPDCFDLLGECDQVVMCISHKEFSMHGFQFHPESILSLPYGETLLRNWFEHVSRSS